MQQSVSLHRGEIPETLNRWGETFEGWHWWYWQHFTNDHESSRILGEMGEVAGKWTHPKGRDGTSGAIGSTQSRQGGAEDDLEEAEGVDGVVGEGMLVSDLGFFVDSALVDAFIRGRAGARWVRMEDGGRADANEGLELGELGRNRGGGRRVV